MNEWMIIHIDTKYIEVCHFVSKITFNNTGVQTLNSSFNKVRKLRDNTLSEAIM